MITQREAHHRFTYDPVSGNLYWKNPRGRKIKPGSLVGCRDTRGYKVCQLNRKMYKQHRLIWLMIYGYWPQTIDHINGVKDDNRLENLRAATSQQNSINRAPRNGLPQGVFRGRNKFRAMLSVDSTQLDLGTYETPEEASKVYQEIAEEWYGDYRYKELELVGFNAVR